MSKIPNELHYTETHEWVKKTEGDILTIGITDYAQEMLGDLVYVDLPNLNRTVTQGEDVAVVESVKTAADIYSPIAGEIIEVNSSLKDSPDKVNQDPYGEGWLLKIKVKSDIDLNHLLSSNDYQKIIEST